MKVKFYLAALCAPVLFAACSEEDLVNNVPSASLEDREKIDLVVTAERPSIFDGATRLGINADGKFVWEKGTDVLGVALADGAVYGTVNADDKVYVNYPFSANSDGVKSTFSGKSAIAKGVYFFHYPYVDHLTRDVLPLNFPSSQTYTVPVKEGDPTSLEQTVKGMKLVSPLYDYATGVAYANVAEFEAKIATYNLYSVVKININPSNIKDGTKAKVQSVSLSANGSEEFLSEASVNTNVLPIIYASDEGAGLTAKENDFYAKVMNQSIYNINDALRAPIVLKVDGELVLANGVATSLYMLVPKGTYADGLTLQVHTSEGVYTQEIDRSITLGMTTGATPVINDGIGTINADMNFKLDGTGNVILPYTFAIPSKYSWENAVLFLEDHAIAYINKDIEFALDGDVAVNNLPVFNLTITGDRNLTLNSDYAVTSENVNQFEATDVTLVIPSGKTLTLNVPMTGFKAIKNNGTLNINANQTKNITNLGTANINGTSLSMSGTFANGKGGDNPTLGTVKIASASSVTADITNNAGTITLEAGKADGLTTWTTASTTNAGNIVVGTYATVTGSLTSTGVITNNGVWAAGVDNTNGEFVVVKGSVSNAVATISNGEVEIKDIVDFAAIANDKDYVFSGARVTTAVDSYKAFKDAMGVADLNDITLSGAWSFDAAVPADETTKVLYQPTGKSLTLSGVTMTYVTAPTAAIDLTLKGTNIFKVAANDVDGKIVKTGNLNVTEGASLTVNNLITVNEKASISAEKATLNGNVTVDAGAKMYFYDVTNNAIITVAGNNTNTIDPGVFGVQNDFKNYNKVQSQQGTHPVTANRKSGMVSQPVNVGDAIFQGNSTSWGEL